MRCALECSVEGKLRLPGDINTAWFNGKQLIIRRDTDGFATLIRIEGRVEPDDLISMEVIQEAGKPLHFKGRGGEKIREELENELQLLESTLGVFFHITRIRWEDAISIAIPETPEEAAQIQWNNFSVKRNSIEQPVREPTLEDFECTLHMGYHARSLATIMSFFREGSADLRTFRHISAFYSFYFVLEGLYANGKFGNKEVRAEFKKSKALLDAITHVLTLPLYIQPPQIKGVVTIDDFLRMVKQPRTVDGVIHMLTWVRGDVHHFVNNPKKLTASPFTHHCYELLASFAHDICLHVVMHEILSRFPKNGQSKIT
jgi:hypothetical protein